MGGAASCAALLFRCGLPAFAVLAAAGPAMAGAWTQDEGRGQIIFSSISTTASSRFNGRGRPVRSGAFRKLDSGLALEWGFREGTTLLATASGVVRSLPAGFEAVGAGSIGLRQRLWRDDRSVLSLDLLAGASGDRRLLGGPAWDAPWHGEAALGLGHSTEAFGLPVFADARAGFRFAGGGRRHAARLDLTLGVRPVTNWLILTQFFAWQEIGVSGGAMPPRRRWLTAQASVVYEGFAPWLVQIGVLGTLAGRETGQETGAVVSLWRRF